jgi:hypothetical protein
MGVIISLAAMIEALESANDQSAHYLDPDTGEILMIADEEQSIIEEEDEESWKDLPGWQQEQLPKVRDFLQRPRTLRLPDQFDIHEWEIMRKFAEGQENGRIRQALLNAIHGSGAFRSFKNTIHPLGVEQDWYKFRQEALSEIARSWLEEHNLKYK